MHAGKIANKKTLWCLSLVLLLFLSFSNNTALESMNSSRLENSIPHHQIISSEGMDLYTEESLTGSIDVWSDNVTSSGVEQVAFIIGDSDGLLMQMNFIELVEYALFKLNDSIMSDSLMLKGFVDGGDIDTLFEVYSWVDPYTEPELEGVSEGIITDDWFPLGMNDVWNDDVLFEYANTSIEYLLLVGRSSTTGPGYFQALDAIEVYGFTNVMADRENDGFPDIWQYPDVDMFNVSIDMDLFGETFGIMGLVGVAPEGISNIDFLLPFIKLGVIEPEEVEESHFYVICQAELTLPFHGAYNYLQFLNSYDLVNMTFIEGNATVFDETLQEFSRYIAHDNRIRTYHVVDYTVDGTYDPHNYYNTQGQINAEYNTLDTTKSTPNTAQEKFDLDVSIVLDIVENVMDAVQQGKDLTEQFMGKIIGFIQGKIMDGVGKALLAKITKKALKSALKAILSITTIKDIIVKGSKILEKLGVTLPDWLRKVRDFVESIPFIDPPVEMWKVRLTFVNETTGLPVLGYDYINNASIYTHPQGIYFGDTYSAQVILSSRDIFPVIGRIQSVNGSRTLTGNLYVEDLGLLDANHAKSSLEPGEAAQGRMYEISPDEVIVISQCEIALASSLPSVVEIGTQFNISLTVSDENGTLLSDDSKMRAAINNLPGPMVELSAVAEADGTLTLTVDTGTLGVDPGDRMVAALYKPPAMFHDYWNFTFVLQDTVSPTIENVSATFSSDLSTVMFSARVTDYDLNASSVLLKTIDGSTDMALATSRWMTFNGSHFVASVSASAFNTPTIYYRVEASDNSGNLAQSALKSITAPTPSELGPLGVFLAVGVGVTVVALVAVYMIRRPGR